MISALLLGTVSLFAQAKDGMSNIEDSISVYYDSFFKYFREEDYERAIYYGSRLKDKWEEAKWEKDSIYCGIAYALANLYNVEGRPELSASILTELAPTAKTVFGDNSLDYVEIISDLAHYHSAFANYTEAMRLGTEVLNIRKKVLGTEHPEYAIALGNLAHYKSALGNYAEAIRLGTEAMEIRKRTVGTEHPDYAAALSNLAHYYSETGNNSEAAVLGTEALEIYKKAYGTEHPDYALALGNLANYYSDLGNYEEAIRLGIEAIEIKKRVLGTEHPDYAAVLSNLASYYSSLGNHAEEFSCINQSLESSRQYVLSSFSELSPELQETLWNENYEYMFNIALPMTVFRYQTDESVAALYDKTALFSKGILLNTGIAMRQLIIESGDPAIIAKYDALSANVGIYEEQMEMPVQERSIDTDSLHSVIQRQEMELARESKAFGDYSSNIRIVLPREEGDKIMEKYYSNPDFFRDSYSFIRNVCAGFLFRTVGGTGTMLNLEVSTMNLSFTEEDSNGKKTASICRFAATPEVIQSTQFESSGLSVSDLVDKMNAEESDTTMLKTPAGICTELTLPIDEIFKGHENDSITRASFTLTRINNQDEDALDDDYALGIPQNILLVRKQNFSRFFEEHLVSDNQQSYTTHFFSTSNAYRFDNISRLISYCQYEKKAGMKASGMTAEEWETAHPDWNRVIIVPVTIATALDSNGNSSQVSVNQDMSLGSTKLVRGTEAAPINLQIIYSRFASK